MGFGDAFDYTTTSEVYDEYTRVTAGTSIDVTGVNHALLQERRKRTMATACERAINYSAPGSEPIGTKRLFTDHQFYTINRRAQIHALSDENTSEPTDNQFPLVLTSGRIRDQWHTMTKTGRVAKLNKHIPQPFLQIQPRRRPREGH